MLRAFAVVAILAWSSLSSAQPAAAQAEVLFREGRELMAKGKLAEACSAFEESQKLEPATSTLLNLASCREKLGQIATAWGLFLDAERQTRDASDGAGKQFHSVAAERVKKLEPRVSKLTISVPQASHVDGLEITRGKDRVDAVMWNRAMPIDGGTYTITAKAPGSRPWSTEITIAGESDTKTVDIPDLRTLSRDVAAPPKPVAAAGEPALHAEQPPEEPEQPQRASSASKTVPIVVGVGAIALLGGAVGFNAWGDSTYSDAKAEMTSQSRRDSLYDSANQKRYIAQGLAVAGVGCAGVAVWLYLHGRHDEHPQAIRAIAPTANGLALVGSF